jgi:DNA polymerase III delta subunit
MISIVLGPDYAMARARMREIRRAQDPSGDSTSMLDGKSVSIRNVMMDIASVGFFSAGRVVIVEDLIARLGKQGAKDGGQAPDWPGLFAAVPDASTLILVDTSLQSLPAAIKKALPDSATVDICDPPRGPALVKWIRKTAKANQSEIDDATARFLAESLYPQSWTQKSNNPAFDRPPDMEMLANEIAKLALASAPGPISCDLILTMVDRGDEDRIFSFLDAAASGRLNAALVELDHLLAAGEDPAKLLAQLSQNVELRAVMATAGRRAPAEVGREIGLSNPNRMSSIQRGMGGQRPEEHLRSVTLAASADRKMKRGELREPLDALYDALLAIASRRRVDMDRG